MKPTNNSASQCKRRGVALILSMIFVVIFSSLAVSVAAFSGTNVQIADNQRKADRARACAESGLDIVRYWLNRIAMSGTIAPYDRFNYIAEFLHDDLLANDITNLAAYYSSSVIVIPTVTLDSENNESFFAMIHHIDNDTLVLDVAGIYGSLIRVVRVNYQFGERAHNVFDFGVASKGPLSLSGNIELEGVNVSIESDVYIESADSLLALSIIGNSQIAGNVQIVNPVANVHLQGGQAGIGGETGDDAIENHVEFGVPPSEFPEPVPQYFESFVTNVIDVNTDTSADATFDNVRILAGTNPTFSGHVTLRGVVYIETPNVVTFTGTTDVIAIIVGDGDITDNSAVNRIDFQGNVSSLPVSELPDTEQFEGLHEELGTFAVAPGFHISFSGNFDTLAGAIAGNGIEFSGDAGGTINGSVINYSDENMALSGNSDLYFNRSGTTEVPAGFVPEVILYYNPATYAEVMN